MAEFRVPARMRRHELEVKRSRFIATVARASDRDEAERFVATMRREFADATHNAYAYIAGRPGSTGDIACSDDGEVAGTAGRPMLNLLQHSGLAEVVAVVTRYYGGTLLGSGGLQRAYSQTLKEALDTLATETLMATCDVQLGFSFALEAAVRRELARVAAVVLGTEYGEQVQMQIQLPAAEGERLRAVLEGVSKGELQWRELDD